MRLVVFDMDGTLIDSHAMITENLTTTFEAEGLTPPTAEEGRRAIGLSLPEVFATLAKLPIEETDNLVARYREVYRASVAEGRHHGESLYAGARETVLALSAEPTTLLGIATGKAMRGVNRVLSEQQLEAHFVTRQTPDHNPSKPDPGMLYSAMNETGVAADQTVMIGDTTFDIEMAVAAGTKSVGVRWGYHEVDELLSVGADVIVETYDDLIPAINSLVGADHA